MSPIKPSRPTTRSQTQTQTTRIQPRKAARSSTPPPSSQPSQPSQPIALKRKRRIRRAGADPWTPKRKKPKTTSPRPRNPPPTHYTCRICAEEQPIDQFIKWVSPSRKLRINRFSSALDIPHPCIAHLSRNPRRKNDPVCKTCISNSLSAKLDQLGARKLSQGCLEPDCYTYWSFEHIMRHLPGTALEKYNIGMLPVWRESVQLMTCPVETCSAISLIDPFAPGYPHVACPSCMQRLCATCLIPWHAGLTCAEHAARHVQEKMTAPEIETLEIMQAKDGKRCPNCFMVIEKDGGCDSMYCMGCRTYFNWATAASAVPGKGTKVVPPDVFGLGGQPVVCEMDKLEGKGVAEEGQSGLYAVASAA
ncbi:uncharacterized protein BDR25DRAFT_306240 [Lindgomyces ingoldianus]|uniref:Uncharacterized protein n=1 Tax=Lindgomyces ingoldianus TaxID=673940 RepID=A0ACB6QHP2_9PLEO|nr:uncharacterized protein BDR25DRAFT_306240 [Lindgomyces ingoldianus]KAF2466456.1 hypothetical protein BDR25DRAFT_306240 [Lindgomyces ingoldianus]